MSRIQPGWFDAERAQRIAGVMGWPVAHSRSPRLHGYWLQTYGIDGAYIPLPVRPEQCAAALRALPMLGFAGVNVTVPHKEAALAAVDRSDLAARRIGAVNTIVVATDGTLDGRNSDGFGFMENLRGGVPGWSPKTGPAVILGAGGAARAVAVALLDGGVPEIRIVNRTIDRAERLSEDIGGPFRVYHWADRAAALGDAALLVNDGSWHERKPPLELASTGYRQRRSSTISSTRRSRRHCWRRQRRVAIGSCTVSGCCCIRRVRDFPPGLASSRR
jgi:shikimate dehydrogenase